MGSVEKIAYVIGTAGHIDHGKTSLVAALTGIDTDRLAEEKRRGVSIDLGFAHIDIPTGGGGVDRAAIVDVPGHERFVRNMLAGTTGIDLVLLVVAADDGVMPQTREHLDIVHLLGITQGIVVITKTDLATYERVEEVGGEVRSILKGTTLDGAPVVGVSAATGAGLDELRSLIAERLGRAQRDAGGFFRLPVDRSFPIKGFGTVVTGTVAAGTALRGDELFVFPTGARVKVRGIQSLHAECESVAAGERAALNLSGVAHGDIERGFTLAAPVLSGYLEAARSAGGTLRVDCSLEFIRREGAPDRVVKNHGLLKLHHMTGEVIARVVLSGAKAAGPGDRLYGRLVLKGPLLMLRGDRFVLRDPSDNTTVGGGVVVLPEISRRHMPPVSALPAVLGRAVEGTAALLAGLLSATGAPGIDAGVASVMLNVSPERLAVIAGGEGAEGNAAIRPLKGFIVETGAASLLEASVVEIIKGFHSAHPGDAGMEEASICGSIIGASVRRSADAPIISALLAGMTARGVLKKAGAIYSLPGHATALVGVEAEIERSLAPLFERGLKAVNADDLRGLPFRRPDIDRVLSHMQRAGRIVRLKEGSFISASAASEARERLVAHLSSSGSITARDFRDILGTGRKLAIELLEYFDSERVTLRRGDERTLR